MATDEHRHHFTPLRKTYGKTARGASSPAKPCQLLGTLRRTNKLNLPATEVTLVSTNQNGTIRKTRTASLAHAGTVINDLGGPLSFQPAMQQTKYIRALLPHPPWLIIRKKG